MSECLAAFHFLRPWWLLLLLPGAYLILRLHRAGPGTAYWTRILDPALLPYLLVDRGSAARRHRLLPFALGALLGTVALAGPTCERLPVPVFRDEAGLVILLDLSRSMLAEDVAPSRLGRARFEIHDLLAARRGGQTALVVFAAQPFTVTPLTDDAQTIVAQLPVLTPALMPSQGSAPARAIERGRELLAQAGFESGDLLLVTDGLSAVELERARRALRAGTQRLSVLAVGTAEGAPIPLADGGFLNDAGGAIVIPKLDPAPLRALAAAGDGLYLEPTADDADTRRLLDFLAGSRTRDASAKPGVEASQWRELGPWLLLPLLACAALAFRRGVLLVLPLLALLGPSPAHAAWWLTPDQAAARAFERGEYAAAADGFARPDWEAAARYRAGDFAGAAAALDEPETAAGQYNLGNALARLGRYDEAIAAYEQALARDPGLADARYNKELLESAQAREEEPPSGSEQDREPADREQQGGEPADEEADGSGDGAGRDAQSAGRDERLQQPGGENPEREHGAGEPSEQQPRSAQADAGGQAPDAASDAASDAARDEAARAEKARGQATGEQEQALATEQWLRQIPDDPGGLWRRKFEYQYGREYAGEATSGETW